MLSDEYWWGGSINDGVIMPFSADTEIEADFRKKCPNQGMPLFLSSRGRYIWSDEPLSVKIKNGVITAEGENITLDMKFVTTDGRKIDMKYQGSIKFPEVVQEIETVALAAAATPKVINNNGRVDGEFYIKMNDNAWNYEMAIDLFADAAAEKIPAGTYTYSAENTPGTFGNKSYADMYKPNMGNCRFADGSKATVSYSGENIIIDLYLIVAEKNKALTMKYEGPINYEL